MPMSPLPEHLPVAQVVRCQMLLQLSSTANVRSFISYELARHKAMLVPLGCSAELTVLLVVPYSDVMVQLLLLLLLLVIALM